MPGWLLEFSRKAKNTSFPSYLTPSLHPERYISGSPVVLLLSLTALAPQVKISKLYGAVIASNLCLSSITLLVLGFRVGKARKECKELAEKEGIDTKQFEYPNMYATGDSELAMRFNCTQRGHQQALETYASFVGLSLAGGIR